MYNKKIFLIFFASISTILLLFSSQRVMAGSITIRPSCVTGGGGGGCDGTCTSPDLTINFTSAVAKVEIGAFHHWDDFGKLILEKPSGALVEFKSSNYGVCSYSSNGNDGFPANLDITGYFNEGFGNYKVRTWAQDNLGAGLAGEVDIIVTYLDPTCNLTSSDYAVWKGDTAILTWTTANATTASINGISVTPVASGSMSSSPITSATNFSMAVAGFAGSTGSCGPVTIGLLIPPIGGLVPCGRLADDPATTEINETKPCDLCAAMYMLKKSINFAMEVAVGIAVFIIVIGGLLYAFSAGNPRNIEMAKSAVTYALLGLAIIFIAWIIIAIILQAMGYAGMATWNQVNCNLQT